jgi:hypothetical protein
MTGSQPSGLADVIETILDKGLVIDAYVRVSLVGIEVLTIDARVVVASVATYLRFADAVGRVGLENKPKGLTEITGGMVESGARGKSRGALEGAGQAIQGFVDKLQGEEEPARRRR